MFHHTWYLFTGAEAREKCMDAFKLEGKEFIELNDLLKVTGLCESGGRAKNMITEGQVRVDGTVELRRRCKIRAGQTIEFQCHRIVVT